jgi:hypothetical protein
MTRPNHQDLLLAVGLTLLTIQAAEKALKLCLPRLVPKVFPKDLDEFLSEERLPRAIKLQVVTALRRNVKVEAGFEMVLLKFLRARNMFVHNAEDIPGWNLNTPEGLRGAFEHCERLYAQANYVIKVMQAMPLAREDLVLNLSATPYFENLKKEFALPPPKRKSGR